MTNPQEKKKSTRTALIVRFGSLAAAILAVVLLMGFCTGPTAAQRNDSGAPAGSGENVRTSHGSYLQSSIGRDDPAWNLPDTAVATEVLAQYTRDEVHDAYRFALTFTAQEGIDSALNGEGVSVADWWKGHSKFFHPDNRPEMLTSLEQGKAVVQREPWQEKDYEGYSYIYDGSPRVLERTITPDAVWLTGDGGIAFRMSVNYTMAVVPGIGEAGDGRQVTHGYMTYSVRETGPGDWAITSFMHDLRTFPG